ncbi:MAG: hypothetical protein AAGA92_07325 [Planctomycetota bacterium]
MIEVLRAAGEVQAFLEQHGWPFAFIGGLAVNRWGRARLTNDADICLYTDIGGEEAYIDALMDRSTPRRADAKDFALISRVVLLTSERGYGVDVSLGAFEFERRAVDRGSLYTFPEGVELRTVSAKDLVVYKAFAGRPQDWIDVEGILVRQEGKLDWGTLINEFTPLCELKEAPETIDRLLALRDSLASG